MRKSKSYEVRNPMNIWNKYDFAMSGLGKKSKILAKIKHFFKCVKHPCKTGRFRAIRSKSKL